MIVTRCYKMLQNAIFGPFCNRIGHSVTELLQLNGCKSPRNTCDSCNTGNMPLTEREKTRSFTVIPITNLQNNFAR